MLSYCELADTPAFRNLVADLTAELGDNANKEAYRDYLERDGELRDASDILQKLSNDYFPIVRNTTTPVLSEIEKSADREIVMTNKEKFKGLGISVPKKQISPAQIINLKKIISTTNNTLAKEGVNRVYTLEIQRVGESENFTWDVKVYRGRLDIQEKAQRVTDTVLDMNRLPSPLSQATKQLELDLQTNIRTALLGIDSTKNGNKNSRTGNDGFNNKVLGEFITGELSDSSKISSGELRGSEAGMVFHSSGRGADVGRIKNIGGKSFKDIFDSDEYGLEEQKLYITGRLYESLHKNKLNRSVREKLHGKLHKNEGLSDIRTIDQPLESFIFSFGGNIYINLYKDEMVSFFKSLYASGVDLDAFIDMAVFEELIHSFVTTQIPRSNVKRALQELFMNPKVLGEVSNYYSRGRIKINLSKIDPNNEESFDFKQLDLLGNEFIRILVQKKILGETTEDIKFAPTSYITKLLDDIWNFLKDIFQRNNFKNSREIVNQITNFIDSENSNFNNINDNIYPLNNTIAKANYSQEIIRKMAEVMGQQVGVDYAFITPAEAQSLTQDAQNPWSGQNSFFFNGKTYFIEGTLTPDDVLHEFVHPIMRGIAKQNPKLLDALYGKVSDSEEGSKVIEEVRQLYPDLDMDSDDFREEVLVRSLTKMQDLNNKGLEKTSEFKKFIDQLLYAIKQYLRGLFGQGIKVADLNVDTSLEQLSKMLERGEKFELDPEVISDNELVAYKNEYNKYIQDFVAENADVKEMEKITNDFFDAVSKVLKNMQDKNDLGALADVLQNNYKTGELQKIKQNLKSYQTLIQQDAKILEDEVELTRQRATAVLNSLGNVDNLVRKVYDGLKEIVKDVDDPNNVQRALYYQKVLNYWSDFVNQANTGLERNGIHNLKMIDNINANVRRTNDMMDEFYRQASHSVLWDKLKVSADNIESKWKDRIAELQRKGAPQDQIDKANKDYQNEKITPDMIEKALKGELKDLNFANAYLEGYGYSPDPVVGGLALFVKDKITEVEVRAQKNFNEAAMQLKPLLDKVGYNPNKPGEIGEKLGQKEKVGRVNTETGEFEEVEVWRFINQFTGADLARDQYLFKIKDASKKYGESGSEEDRKALAAIQADWEQHRRDFFHNEYTEDFYKAYDVLKKDEIGQEARLRMNDLYDELNLLSGQMEVANSSEILDIADQIEVTRRQIKQLSSLYDIAGNLKTGIELDVAKRLQEFNEAIKDIYKSEEIPDAFQNALQTYEQKLLDEHKKPGSSEYEDLRNKWLEKNTRVVIKESFWTKMDELNGAIKNILSSIPQQDAANLEIDEAYKIIKDLVKGNRDESGQPLGSELSPERQEKIKAAQERIDKARENLNRMSGLNKQEQNELNSIMMKFHMPGVKMDQADSIRLSQLMDKQNALRLDKIQRAELNSLFNELSELRSKEPTDSYIDTVNNFLDSMAPEALYEVIKGMNIDKTNAFLMANEDVVNKLFELSSEFEEWFKRNHILKDSVDMQTNETKQVWERTYAWNVIRPRDDKFYEKTSVKNAKGEDVVIDGLPSMKYYKRLVKDEYLTKKVEGVTVDNRGYWLPKSVRQGAKDDRYENKDFSRLKQTNPDTYNLLEKMKEIHLKNQKGLNKKSKLYLDMPRYRKHAVERLLSKSPIRRIMDKMETFWTKAKDQWEEGLNWDTNSQLVKLDLFDPQNTSAPISGISNLNIDEVSTDVIFTTMKYMLAAEKTKQLNEIAPIARMVQNIVNNEKNYPLQQKLLSNGTIIQPGGKKTRYLRQKAVNNLIEKTFEGVENVGFGSDSVVAQKFSNLLFKTASGAFLNLNIPSALKNSIGQKFQGLIESTAGKYMSTKDFTAAESWATSATFKISGELYKNGPKTLDVQMVELFDPEQGRFSRSFGESSTRTFKKDYSFLLLQRMTDFRKWSQLQASLQTFAGMMKHQKVQMGDKTISYLDAWEVKDGRIQLKEGIDKSWGVSYDEKGEMIIGDKFKQKRNEIHRVMDNLNGAMSKESRPEADRYLLFRYVSFFRRYLTSMLTNRFAKNRVDYQLGNFKEGFYLTFIKLLANTVKSFGKNLPFMTPEEKAASMRFLTEAGVVAIIKYLVIPIVLGFDSDDDDRFKKLRARSGPLPWLGVTADPLRPFDLGGWLSNHILLETMQVESENQQFLPFPGMGLSSYKQMLDVKSLVFGPTVKSWFDILQDTANLATGDERAYYQKNIGPYDWQDEESAKIFNHFGKMFGVTGSNVDPAVAIKNLQSIQNR